MKSNLSQKGKASLTSAFAFLALCSAAAAGGASGAGNGGLAYVCRDSKGAVQKAYLLDLLEAEADGKTIDPNARLETVFARIPSTQLRERLQKEYKEIFTASMKFADARFGLLDPNDYLPRVTLKDCRLETIGPYDDVREELRIDSEVLMALPPVHREAFYAHETIYKIARKQGATNSNEVRPLVGDLFTIAYAQDAQYTLHSQFLKDDLLPLCALYVESVRVVRTTDLYAGSNEIIFNLRADAPGDSVIEAGYVFLQGGHGAAEWRTKQASRSGPDIWTVGISIPARFNHSYAEIAFYAKTAQGHEYWLNKDGVAGRNFLIDVSLYYVIDGFSREKMDQAIRTSSGPEPEAIRQFNPARCEPYN